LDTPGLVALYASLGEDDVYRRFFSAHAPPESFIEKMAQVEERGGVGLVAVIESNDGSGRVVGEATCERIGDDLGELGITVAEDARGWLGPYLLDALVEQAAVRGMSSIQADVLLSNRRMLSLLRSRGLAVVEHSEQPAIVRVRIGTAGHVPAWAGAHDHPRLLIEVPGGRWPDVGAARAAGFQVLACPGPLRGWSQCPALHGEPCPLAAGADLIVDAVPGEAGRSLLEAHRSAHHSVPVCIDIRDETGEPDDVARIPRGADQAVVIGLLQRLAKAPPTANDDQDAPLS